VRPAIEGDAAAIRAVVTAAFGRSLEARIVEDVRAEAAALAELVAEAEGEVIGHLLLSRMTARPARVVAALGPLAVRPELQRLGHGGALVRAGVDALRLLDAEACVVLGHPGYYPRFGFSTAAAAQLASPYAGLPAFMALELQPDALAHPLEVAYPAAFG